INGAPFTDAEQDIPLWSDAKSKIDALVKADKLSDEQAQQLTEQTRSALQSHFLPAYTALKQWLEQDVAKSDQIATGVGKQTDGKAFYDYRLKVSTTTDLTAEQIHQIGLDEVARLTKEMIAIKDKVGFTGDLKAFFKFIKDDDQFY